MMGFIAMRTTLSCAVVHCALSLPSIEKNVSVRQHHLAQLSVTLLCLYNVMKRKELKEMVAVSRSHKQISLSFEKLSISRCYSFVALVSCLPRLAEKKGADQTKASA